MNKIKVIFISLIISTCLTYGEDIYLDKIPWTGDWLPLSKNIMVQGEGFYGYPGPLVKLGLINSSDLSPVAYEYEERYLVDLTTPSWFGNCDGWAAAALLYDDPPAIISNGIKLLVPEMRALLSASRADNRIIPFGASDGLTAKQFHTIIEHYLKNGRGIIFDMDLSAEKWNFPVAGYDLSESTDTEGFTHVHIKLILTMPISMWAQQPLTQPIFYESRMEYKYNESDVFDWVSDERPQFAWLPADAFFQDRWSSTSNRFISPDFLFNFMEENAAENPFRYIDPQEPNNSDIEAFQIENKITLGCLKDNDPDIYSIDNMDGLLHTLELVTYDGPAISWEMIKSTDGTVLSAGVGDITFDLTNQDGDQFLIRLFGQYDQFSFYLLRLPTESHFVHSGQGSSPGMIINYHDEGLDFTDCGITGTLEPFSSHLTQPLSTQDCAMFLNREVPFFQGIEEDNILPYFLPEINQSHTRFFPHIAHLYDWGTELYISSPYQQTSYRLSIYDADGTIVYSEDLIIQDFDDMFPLADIVRKNLPPTGYWFSLKSLGGQSFHAEVRFIRNDIGKGVSFVLNSQRDSFGDFLVSDIYSESKGWNGIAIVNISNSENQILYKVIDHTGHTKTEGSFFLAPKQKFLTLADHLLEGETIAEGDFLRVFSNYPISAIHVSAEYTNQEISGDFLLSQNTDFKAKSVWPLLSGNFIVMNRTNRFNHILFEGYDQDGVRIGRFNTELGKPIPAFTTGIFPISQILENGVLDGDINDITHFVISIPDDVFIQFQRDFQNNAISFYGNSPLPYLDYSGDIQNNKNRNITYDVLEIIK